MDSAERASCGPSPSCGRLDGRLGLCVVAGEVLGSAARLLGMSMGCTGAREARAGVAAVLTEAAGAPIHAVSKESKRMSTTRSPGPSPLLSVEVGELSGAHRIGSQANAMPIVSILLLALRLLLGSCCCSLTNRHFRVVAVQGGSGGAGSLRHTTWAVSARVPNNQRRRAHFDRRKSPAPSKVGTFGTPASCSAMRAG